MEDLQDMPIINVPHILHVGYVDSYVMKESENQ